MLGRNFGLFFAGSFLSNIGTFFQIIAQGLLMYELTRSSLAVGAVGFASSITSLLLGPWAGTLADRLDRRRLLIWTQVVALATAAVQAALTFAGLIDAVSLIGCALALGLSNAFATPVQYAILPDLVDRSEMQGALQMNSVTFNIGRVIGPVLGVITVNQLGYGWAFLVNAVSFLALIAALFIIRTQPSLRSERPMRLFDMVRLVRTNRRIALLLLMVLAVVCVYDPIQTLAPGLVQDVFQAPKVWVGWMLGALGTGAIIGTLLRTGQPTMLKVSALLGLFGAGMLLYALAPRVELAILGPLCGGVGYLLSNTGAQGLLFREAGQSQAGQVMALYSMAFIGVRPFISLADGALADALGIRQAAVVMTLPAIVVVVIAAVSLRGERHHSAAANQRS